MRRVALLAACLLLGDGAGHAATLRSPIVDVAARPDGARATSRCPAPPAAVRTLGGVSYYTDPHHSVIDPELQASNERMQRPVVTFVDRVVHMSDSWRQSRDEAKARCVARWLDTWAQADAFRDTSNVAGGYRRSWYLSGLAIVWLKVRDASGIDADQRLHIAAWLTGQGRRMVDFYAAPERQRDALNNHGDWAALAVAAIAVGAGDDGLYKWADARFRINLAEITPDGTLPLEMARGQRALHYHMFALTPLLLMARFEQANARAYDADALDRLERFTRAALEHPAIVERKAGIVQELPRAHGDPSELTWASLVPARPGARLAGLLDAREPLVDPRAGGDVRLTWPLSSQP